jgi:hypothetical protein
MFGPKLDYLQALTKCKVHTEEGKAIPLQAWRGREGSRRLKLLDFKTIGTGMWQGCQPYARAAFTLRKYSLYSLLLEG